MGRNDDWQKELGDELKRAATEAARGLADQMAVHAQRARERHEKTRATRRRDRRLEKLELIRARRDAKFAGTSPLEGWFHILTAIVLFGFAYTTPYWWLMFIGFAFAAKGVQIIGYYAERKRPPAPEGSTEEAGRAADPRQARIDSTCDRLLAALEDAPPSIRSFLSDPEQTVETLRRTCHDLLARERSLRELVSPEDDARLQRERESLVQRIARERDDVVRERLQAALATLDTNRQQQSAILRSADRLEAEQTRLGYTLDGLYAQVMRLRTADPHTEASASEGLRISLAGLRDEITALADALEQANLTTAVAARSTMSEAPPPLDGPSRGRRRERT